MNDGIYNETTVVVFVFVILLAMKGRTIEMDVLCVCCSKIPRCMYSYPRETKVL